MQGIMGCQGRELWIIFITYGTKTSLKVNITKWSPFIYIQMYWNFKLAIMAELSMKDVTVFCEK